MYIQFPRKIQAFKRAEKGVNQQLAMWFNIPKLMNSRGIIQESSSFKETLGISRRNPGNESLDKSYINRTRIPKMKMYLSTLNVHLDLYEIQRLAMRNTPWKNKEASEKGNTCTNRWKKHTRKKEKIKKMLDETENQEAKESFVLLALLSNMLLTKIFQG